ncbi:hypothetical protein CRUP_026116 [Coryphaenoides rupestris]|nr:hypothetical protein CRUP_026116 [Coryphaenoides rupestris]
MNIIHPAVPQVPQDHHRLQAEDGSLKDAGDEWNKSAFWLRLRRRHEKVIPSPSSSSASPPDGPVGGAGGGGSERERGGPGSRTSLVAGGLVHTMLAHRDRLLSHTAERGLAIPSALPQHLLPLLGRGLSAASLPGGHGGGGSTGRRLRPPPPPPPPASFSSSSSSSSSSPPPPPPPPRTQPQHHTDIDGGGADEIPSVPTATADLMDSGETETSPPVVPGCVVNFSDPEGYIDSSDYPPLPDGTFLYCNYTVTVYVGYGVELQVKSVNLTEGEHLSIQGEDESGGPLVLANQSLLVEGQVIRSPTNALSVFYHATAAEGSLGVFQLHYQIFRLSCALPRKPHFGEVSVLDLLPGGIARFSCHMGYHLQGAPTLVCRNASLPDRSCSWSLEAPKGQRLHLHLERLALGPTDRLVLWSGLDAGSVVLYDSGRGGPIPFEGVISEGPAVRVQFITDQPNHSTGFNVRYEEEISFHGCVGAVVQFICDPGHSLEQGPPVIECINSRDPYWNDTEPICKALCGGGLAGPAGVIMLNISDSDMLTILDGDEVTTRILGQYVGGISPFKLASTTPDLTVTFHSDPAGLVFGKGEGFIINYMVMYCSDPGHVEHSTRSLSDPKLLVGTTIQYSCSAGFVLQGGATLTCYGREPGTPVWTSKLPHCVSEESVSCENPGLPDSGYQILSKRLYLPGESLTFVCYQGYELIGEVAIKCILGKPSFWSGPLPLCRACFDGNSAASVVLLWGVCRYPSSNLRLPLIYPNPYRHITVEAEFDNPLYETGGLQKRRRDPGWTAGTSP